MGAIVRDAKGTALADGVAAVLIDDSMFRNSPGFGANR